MTPRVKAGLPVSMEHVVTLSENFSADGVGNLAEIFGTPEILPSPSACRKAFAKVY